MDAAFYKSMHYIYTHVTNYCFFVWFHFFKNEYIQIFIFSVILKLFFYDFNKMECWQQKWSLDTSLERPVLWEH